MKLVKLGVFALALGLFATSCNNESSTSTETKTDSAAMAPAPMEAPAATPAPATTDSAAMNAAGTTGADTMHTQAH